MLDDPSLNVRNYSFSQYSRCPGDRDFKHPVTGQPNASHLLKKMSEFDKKRTVFVFASHRWLSPGNGKRGTASDGW